MFRFSAAACGAVLAAALLTLASPSAAVGAPRAAADCLSSGEADFNGDGYDDAVVGDPDAVVDGKSKAGQVHVLYGGPGGLVGEGGARALLRQGMAGVGETLEAGDGFGARLLAARVDEDNCVDLVVGVPGENLGSATDAGVAHVIFGSPSGLGQEFAAIVLKQGSFDIPGAPESGDRFGHAVALEAPEGPDGTVVAVGVPGEDLGSRADAGVVDLVWVSGFSAFQGIAISQNTPGVPGAVESGDRFGHAVVVGFVRGLSDWPDVIAGAPGEDIGGVSNAGAITVVDDAEPYKTNYSGQGVSQSSAGVPGSVESGDQFGYSLAYGQSGAAGRLAVGVPYENIGSVSNAGMLHLFSSNGASLSPGAGISQNSAGILGAAETGDRFGLRLAMATASVTGAGVHVVAGLPYEDIGSVADAGAVQVLPVTSPASDLGYDQSSPGIGGAPQPGDRLGWSVDAAGGSSEGALLVGVPFDQAYSVGEVQVIPYGGTPRQWLPGAGGIPAGGAGSFGVAVS